MGATPAGCPILLPRAAQTIVGHGSSTKAPRLAFRLEECQDVADADRALDVADNGPVLVVEELNPHLGDAATAAGAAEDHRHLAQLGGLLLRWGTWERNTRCDKDQQNRRYILLLIDGPSRLQAVKRLEVLFTHGYQALPRRYSEDGASNGRPRHVDDEQATPGSIRK